MFIEFVSLYYRVAHVVYISSIFIELVNSNGTKIFPSIPSLSCLSSCPFALSIELLNSIVYRVGLAMGIEFVHVIMIVNCLSLTPSLSRWFFKVVPCYRVPLWFPLIELLILWEHRVVSVLSTEFLNSVPSYRVAFQGGVTKFVKYKYLVHRVVHLVYVSSLLFLCLSS